jgi:hypothetical protein
MYYMYSNVHIVRRQTDGDISYFLTWTPPTFSHAHRYFVQAAVTREGPVKNLMDFIEDPAHNNIGKYIFQ